MHPPSSRRPSLDVVPLAFLLAHIPLGLAMEASASLARLHGFLTIAVVMGGSLVFPRLSAIIYGVVYLAMGDVFWRMTEAGLPWEISKYGIVFVAAVVLARFYKRLPDPLSIGFFALLVPGAMITLLTVSFATARDQISFNLSGPLALACGVALFSVVRLRAHEFRRLTYLAVAPLAGVWVIAFQALLKTETFSTNSSKEAVGGFGPNQVSTMLGFGALLCIMWALREPAKLHRLIFFTMGTVLLIQSALTFSRGGLYNCAAALLCVGLLYIKRPSRVLFGLFGLLLFLFAVSPLLDEIDGFTDGQLAARFAETDVTGRDEIAGGDLDVWRQSPITGVGVGRSKELRETLFAGAAAHTEFTRIIAEHGVLGILSIGVLGLIALRNLGGRQELWEQAWSLALMVWTAAAMTNAAMRVGAISLAFGMSSLRLVPTVARSQANRLRSGASANVPVPPDGGVALP